MDKSTKCCEVKAHLTNGQAVIGMFHVPARTSSAIRPSDALMEKNNGLLLLSDATLQTQQGTQPADAVIIPFSAVAFIELPSVWTARAKTGEDAGHEHVAAPLPPPPPPPKTPTAQQAHVSKWLARGGNSR